MALRPGPEEMIRGVQHSLMAQLLPELKAPYAAAQAGYAAHLLDAVLALQDGAAQQLADDNATLRQLLGDAAHMLRDSAPELTAPLLAASQEQESDLRLGALSAANDRLRALVSELAPLAVAGAAPAGLLHRLLDGLEESARRRLTGAL